MSQVQLSPVPFHGDTIFCINYQGQPYTPMRPIVENMGLAWQAQAVKLNANRERWTVTNIVTVAQDGVEREMLSMPVRKLPAWLNSINPKKVRPELRAKIELYQAESDDALWDYWMNGRAERASLPADVKPLSTAASRAPLRSLVHAWAQVSGVSHSALWPQVRAHFQLSRIDDLPESWLPDALAFVQEKIDQCGKGLPLGQRAEVHGNGFPPSAPAAPVLRPDFPADMDNGRKDALKKIQSLTWGVHAALDVVKLFCNPRYIPGPGADVPLDIALNLFKSAQANLVAAYNDLEAGYSLGKFFERG